MSAPFKKAAAAAYVRMSTEHQQYSLENQMDVIRAYAETRGMEIVKVYSDGGKSGLSIAGRDSLAEMIGDVKRGAADFTSILVYDVSRWGRFQDTDESAHYEYTCRLAGITVHFCAEQFENDGSPVSTIVKGVKRAMAAEYSRELSSKVFQGSSRLIQLGFKQGGTAGYGLRRLLIDQAGNRKNVLQLGEQKSIHTDRVILIPGPEEELSVVRWMYGAFVNRGKTESAIAVELNAKGTFTDLGRAWTRATVHQVLTNEKYVGNNIYNRTSFKLKKKHVQNSPDKWIRADGAFEAIVDPELFEKARAIIAERSLRLSDEEMLERLRGLCDKYGRVSGILIDEVDGLPSSSAYRSRFGSLLAAYRLIGFEPPTDYSFIEVNRRLREERPKFVEALLQSITNTGGIAQRNGSNGLVELNGEVGVSIVLCKHTSTGRGSSRWLIPLGEDAKPDLTIAVRMDAANREIRDYYVLPSIDVGWDKIKMAEDNGLHLDAYRFTDLNLFIELTKRQTLDRYEQ